MIYDHTSNDIKSNKNMKQLKKDLRKSVDIEMQFYQDPDSEEELLVERDWILKVIYAIGWLIVGSGLWAIIYLIFFV